MNFIAPSNNCNDFNTGVPVQPLLINYLEGNGLLDERPLNVQELMDSGRIIKQIRICRNPIKTFIQNGLNILTFGNLINNLKDRNYDYLYHLYLVLTLDNGVEITIEKNERVNIIDGALPIKYGGVCSGIINVNISLKDFFKNTEKNHLDNGMYRYSAFKNNCQDFLIKLLNSNGINDYNDFILQKVDDLAPEWLKKVSNVITDTAGYVNYSIKGGAEDDEE